MNENTIPEGAVAIADLLDHQSDLVDQVEGLLLVAGSREDVITPVRIAQDTPLERATATNLFRQLETQGAVRRHSYEEPVAESPYSVNTENLRSLFDTTRSAIDTITAYQDRQPPETTVTPLVTFPDDPAFDDVTPDRFGMSQLLSVLASQIKDASDSIVIVSPFFEGTGFERLYGVLADAIERGVDITIVTRYLEDTTSHNFAALSDFVEYVREDRGLAGGLHAVDYTVWNEDIPPKKRTQDGAKPVFTLHAKVMLFDEQAAYIGSANVTDYGFDRFLELGVLLEGPAVKCYRELCEYLLDSNGATRIHL